MLKKIYYFFTSLQKVSTIELDPILMLSATSPLVNFNNSLPFSIRVPPAICDYLNFNVTTIDLITVIVTLKLS